MSKKIASSFVNGLGQTVRIPSLLTNASFLRIAQLAATCKDELDDAATSLDVTFASGRKLKPRVCGILPAFTEIVFLTFAENQNTFQFDLPVVVTVDDMFTLFDELGISSIVNPYSFRAAWNNVVSRNRDGHGRQLNLTVYMALGNVRLRSINIARVDGGRGRPPIGYYFQ